jgi:hypothetical protein
MVAKAVIAARPPDATQPGTDAIYRSLFDSFNPDSGARISPTGIGCLIARREALGRLRRPWFAGESNVDDVERFVTFAGRTYADRVVGTDGLAARRGC